MEKVQRYEVVVKDQTVYLHDLKTGTLTELPSYTVAGLIATFTQDATPC